MNLLRPKRPLASLASIRLLATIEIEGSQRMGVRFTRGGWQGPYLYGTSSLHSAAGVFTTASLARHRRAQRTAEVCRGNAGSLLALLRRTALTASEFLPTQDAEPCHPIV